MIWAVCKTMGLRLLRDRGALVLAFLLPGFIYAVFAAIFSSASGGNLDIRVALALQSDSPSAQRLSDAITDQTDFSVSFDSHWSQADIIERVRLGTEDVGLIIRTDMTARSDAPPLLLITEPSRQIAADVLSGQLRNILSEQMPDILLSQNVMSIEPIIGHYTPQQSARITQALSSPDLSADGTSDPLFARHSAIDADSDAEGDASVSYYVGATAILFLLFSAMQGAALSLEERGTGITDRLLMGPRGAGAMMLGKFLFLTLQGTLQAIIILIVAAVFFGVSLTGHTSALLIACLLAAMVAAAIALLVATLCKSSVQMNTVATFVVLLFSAIGGSMVPRFMMPKWMQSLGNFTPNGWVVESFYAILARGSAASQLVQPFGILLAITAFCLLASALISHRMMRY